MLSLNIHPYGYIEPHHQNRARAAFAWNTHTGPTVTFRVLFVLVILAHERHRVVHFNITEHPTAQWTAQQVVEAFPWATVPQYLLRDRDRIYRAVFRQRVKHMDIKEVVIAPKSPWQNPYVERLIGSIRRECSRSCDGLPRAASAAHPHQLLCLLSPLADAFIADHGLS